MARRTRGVAGKARPRPSPGLAATLLALLLAGCSPTMRLEEAAGIDRASGYRARNLGRTPGREEALRHHYMILAFSGGGTRATALAHGVLRELEATPAPAPARPGLTLLEAVDMISSASGGSVAAANYVVHGREGYRRLDARGGFLEHNGIAELVAGVIATAPFHAVGEASRIELLGTMMARQVVGYGTYAELSAARAARRPLLVLNSADMASGERFAFTQDQLDLLCLDLERVRVADAIAASAAFPGALTPLPLPNRSPCQAQRTGQGREMVERLVRDTGFTWDTLREACGRFAQEPIDTTQLAFLSRGRRQYQLLNRDACGEELPADDPRRVRSVHLLDGGIADNLGLAGPLETLTARGDDPRVRPAIRRGEVRRVVIVAVNARSQPDSSVGRDGRTPGVASMILATIGAAIDGRSGGLLAQLDILPELIAGRYGGTGLEVVPLAVDFEMIRDPECRVAFQNIGTTWSLSRREVDALQEMASALLRSSPAYLRLAGLAEGPALDAALAVGQARGRGACARLLRRPDAPAALPEFGGGPAPAVTSRPASSRG
jgi:hypothetical protein